MVLPATQRIRELSALAMIAARGALTAGRAVMEVYARDFTVDYKDDRSPLTDADRASHDALMEALQETGIPVLSEESESVPYEERGAWPSLWLVDPLDGTKEFVKRNGDFTVNVALIEKGRPVLGVVYVPAHEELYVGVAGLGAYRGGTPISPACPPTESGEAGKQSLEASVNDFPNRWKNETVFFQSLEKLGADFPRLPLDRTRRGRQAIIGNGAEPSTLIRVVASRSHGTADTETFIRRLEGEGRRVERVSRGSALKLCMVACGEAHVYPRLAPTMEWDTAAAQAVVECAGGAVVVYDDALHAAYMERGPSALAEGRPLSYNRPDLLNPWFVAIHPRWNLL